MSDVLALVSSLKVEVKRLSARVDDRRACRICHAAYQREHYGPGKKSAAR